MRFALLLSLAFGYPCLIYGELSSLQKQDPYPVFSSDDPDNFLCLKERLRFKDERYAKEKKERFSIAISPYGQNADSGADYQGRKFLPLVFSSDTSVTPPVCNEGIDCTKTVPIELGDITGRVNMLALLYGPLPAGKTLPPTLQTAYNQIFPGLTPPVNDQTLIDPNQEFASFSFPLKYHKRGLRFDFFANIVGDFGLNVQTGVASISQTVRSVIDLNCKVAASGTANQNCWPTPAAPIPTQVEQLLMEQYKPIFEELGISICPYNVTSVEEVRFNLYWRHIYDMNEDKKEWPHFLLMPFAMLSASASPGKRTDPADLFAVPFGNNGHPAVGGTAGFSFDFVDTIEIAAEVGVTHFFSRNVNCMHVPNDEFQKTLFPFTTNVKVSPGMNWSFAGKIGAYHFLDNLSVFFQYVMVEHKQDTITLNVPDPAFEPGALACTTPWKVKVANIGFNYDLSPNLDLGFLWQAPLSQRNTYRSTTILFTFKASF
jgi:hypothetical protein